MPSDVLVAGLPGPLMEWTVTLLARGLEQRHGTVTLLPIGDTQWSPRDIAAPPRLFLADFMRDEWAATIRAGHMAAVLVIDDVEPVREQLRRMGQAATEVRHNFVAVATSFGDLAGLPHVLAVTDTARRDPVKTAVRVLAHAGLADVAASIPDVQDPGDLQPAEPMPDALASTIETIIQPALKYGRTGARRPIRWPRSCLLWGDSPGTPLPRVLDLTGPSRIIAYGPYLALPAGTWTMTATFALSPASRGAMLSLALHGASELGRIAFTVEGPGLFKAVVPIFVVSPRESLEIRLEIERGAIEGTIGIDEIAFDPV